ncbi:MAG TPA: DNA/RNA nuclease SfsA [Bdellovibrionales bacterium]|nr:DNA/RNA nuclease SfsA [Bdellovibrionales bacterium]
MKFESPLKSGIFLKRYKRFFADFIFEDATLTAHIANSGSMKGCSEPNSECRFLHFTGETTRKIPYSLEMIRTPTSWVGVNTARPNQLIWEAWQANAISHWKAYDRAQKEVKINEASRIDFVLWSSNSLKTERLQKYDFNRCPPRLHLVEVKNVSMAAGSTAVFPDAVTERGQKHLRDLMKAIDQGHTAEIVYVIQREDCTGFAPADDIDPEYGKLLRKAERHGVRVTPYRCRLSETGIDLIAEPLELKL